MAIYKVGIETESGTLRLVIGGDEPDKLHIYPSLDENASSFKLDKDGCIALARHILTAADMFKEPEQPNDTEDILLGRKTHTP